MALIDLFLIALYLLGMAGMGFYFMRRNRDADAYFRADGHLPCRLSFAGKPHLLLYGTMGMAVCLAVAPVCSRFRRERK